jgi:DNA-binding NtrC family response regulator
MSNKFAEEPAMSLSPNRCDNHIVTNASSAPFALVIDDEEDICQLVASTLAALGIESATFSAAKPAVASLDQRWPAIIFLDVALEQSDAIDVIRGLSERHYTGTVQLMSSGRPWLLEAVQRLATRHALTLRPPLQKPVQGDTIRAVIASVGLCGSVLLQPH